MKAAYKLLSGSSQNGGTYDDAVKFYYENIDAMDAAYPLLRNDMMKHKQIVNAVKKFCDKELKNNSELEGATSSQKSFINVYNSEAFNNQEIQTANNITVENEIKKVTDNLSGMLAENITPQENFRLPNMGDYYLGDVDKTFLEQIDKNIREKKDAQKACHYAGTAPAAALGYNKSKDLYFLKCNVNYEDNDIDFGLVSGDHIVLDFNQISTAEDDATGALDALRERLKSNNSVFPEVDGHSEAWGLFDMQIMGISAPRLNRWCKDTALKSSLNIKTIKVINKVTVSGSSSVNQGQTQLPKYWQQYQIAIASGYTGSYDEWISHTAPALKKSTVQNPTVKETSRIEVTDSSGIVINEAVVYDTSVAIEPGKESQRRFAYICSAWREIRNVQENDTTITFEWLLSEGETGVEATSGGEGYDLHKTGIAAAQLLLQKIKDAGGVVYINLDGSGLGEGSTTFPCDSAGTWSDLNNQADLQTLVKNSSDISMTGYNIVSMGVSRRFLGELYVRTSNEVSDQVFINLAKLVANDESVMNQGVTYSTDYEGNHKNNFDTIGYDVNARTYADAFFETLNELDDRKDVQKQLLGVDWANLQDYNVILGDTCFFVPPTNIRMQVYTKSERMELLRAKGSATKTAPHQIRKIAMDIFFNESRGINGLTYIEKLPGDKNLDITYSMNGLRSLMSMFRFTPFLPITNRFINKTLGIDAVTLDSLSIQSVPNYPKLIQATVVMGEFDWAVYMPDISQLSLQDSYSSLTYKEKLENDNTVAYWNRSEEEKEAEREKKRQAREELKAQHIQNLINGVEDDYDASLEELNEVEELTINKDVYKNWFATAFNWKTFRYYYQRPIVRGNFLAISGLDFNSDLYIAQTCGAMTSFVPMEFMDSSIKFYMADENYLKEILKERYEMLRGVTEISFNNNQIEFLEACGEVNDALQALKEDGDFVGAMKELNDFTDMSRTQVNEKHNSSYHMFSDISDVLSTSKKTVGATAGAVVGGIAGSFVPVAGTTAGAAIGAGIGTAIGAAVSGGYNVGCITNDMGMRPEGIELVNRILAIIDKQLEPLRLKYNTYFEVDMDYISYLNGETSSGVGIAVFGVGLKIKEGAMSTTDMDSFKKNIATYMKSDVFNDNVRDYDITEAIGMGEDQKNRIVIPLAIEIEDVSFGIDSYMPTEDAVWEIKGDSGAMKFLAGAKALAEKYRKLNESGGFAETVPDVNSLMNLKYNEWELGETEPLVVSWNAQFVNRFVDLRVLSSDGSAPQYLGGSDVALEVTIQTQDETTAKKLIAIPTEITRLTRIYHMVMPCVPLRIESEFSKFLGVNEVTCENATITTNENYPGLYTVKMTFISMDRTVREREAAVRRAVNNGGWNKTYNGKTSMADWWSGGAKITQVLADNTTLDTALTVGAIAAGAIIGAILVVGTGGVALGPLVISGAKMLAAIGIAGGAGVGAILPSAIKGAIDEVTERVNELDSFGDGVEISRKYLQYFEMKKALAENDLYPDLELPTIEEMKKVGYLFMRYNFDDERVYVDPDFYFVYPMALQSHIYRELAIHGMEHDLGDVRLTDSTGACATLHASNLTGYTVGETTEIYNRQKAESRKRRTRIQRALEGQRQDKKENKKRKEDVPKVSMASLAIMSMDKESWQICDDIGAIFMESRYRSALETYDSKEAAASAGNTDINRGTSSADSIQQAEQAVSDDNKATSEAMGSEVKPEQVQTESKVKTVNHTEGKFIAERLQPTIKSMNTMMGILQEKSIFNMFPEHKVGKFSVKTGDEILDEVSIAVSNFLKQQDVDNFLGANSLFIDNSEKFKTDCKDIVFAAACAATSDKEYSAKADSNDWKPRNATLGYIKTQTPDANIILEYISSDDTEEKINQKLTRARDRAVKFGVFGIPMYTLEELNKLIQYKDSTETFDKKNIKAYTDKEAENFTINFDYYLLDPYYRRDGVSIEEIEEYKLNCMKDIKFCTYAFMRIMMYWLCRLVIMHALPAIYSDMFRQLSQAESETISASQENVAITPDLIQKNDKSLIGTDKYIKFFQKCMPQLDAGKMYTAAILALSNGDVTVLDAINKREYKSLNSLVQSCLSVNSTLDAKHNYGPYMLRKMTLALVGRGVIDSMSALGVNQSLPSNAYSRDQLQRLYLAAAQDPKTYIPHSYHDMIVHDARGRMLRAFPTFYMCFIDEGREIGFWKLHDNFYNTSSIMNIEVVKSRKIPADTCTIVMSNFYNSYTTEAEDYVKTQVATMDQAWNSIFSPSEYFKEMETKRLNKPPEIKLRLRQGARIHVRMGYGNNAAMLPVLFNGVVTEVSSTEAVEIIAQGDGWELMNPIQIDKEAQNITKLEDWFNSVDNGDTPLQIVTGLFNTHGGILQEKVRNALGASIVPRNPFGIVHFGDPDFKTFVKCGEACQNLYEISNRPIFGGQLDVEKAGYDNFTEDKGTPQITFDLFQKTPWDVLNICRSMDPDFRLGVIPFGFRSTVFMGAPHYYYCYDYFKDVDGVIKEKRKPFQQWHIYSDKNDIIGNGIVATARDMHNVAVGMYTESGWLNNESQETVGPLYADWDIYPESQRSMIVDTNLLGKGAPYVGALLTNGVTNFLERTVNAGEDDMSGIISWQSAKKVAWRATASALRDGVQDMYAGDLVLYGDPSIKPQDRFYMSDSYSGIMGQALVKEVVYRMSVETGFTTTISPDCISCVNDDHEIICTTNFESTGCIGTTAADTAYDLIHLDNDLKYYAAITAMGVAGYGAGWLMTRKAASAYAKAVEGSAIKTAGDMLKSAGGKVATKVSVNVAGRAMLSLLRAVGPIRIATTLASTLVLPFVNAFIEDELKNYKVIKIYPLKKFGYVYTAGFEGARGTVYGSPTWGDRGSLGDLFDAIQDNCPILGTIADFIFNDEVKSLASKYQRDNSIINNDGTAADMELKYGQFSAHLAGDNFTYQASGYREQQLSPRATLDKPASMQATVTQLAMTDVEHYHEDPKLKRMRLISQDSRLRDYVNEQFLLIIHEDPGMNTGKYAEEDTLVIDGKSYRTKYYKSKDTQGNDVIDIPLLHNDAMNILYEIVRRAKNYMPNANSMDKNENYELLKNSYLVVKSALRIGDKTSMGATGCTFIIAGTDETSQRALKSALTNLDAEIKSDENKALGYNTEIFSYKEDADKEVRVFVNPPQMADENTMTRYQNKNTENNSDSTVTDTSKTA